jgi:hypothetical protein
MSISALGIGMLRTSSIRPRSQLRAPASPPSSNSDSIAIEVERIAEAQRFTARLAVERSESKQLPS